MGPYKPAGDKQRDSDISNGRGIRERPESREVNFPVRHNIDELMEGRTLITSQYPENSLQKDIEIGKVLPIGHAVDRSSKSSST